MFIAHFLHMYQPWWQHPGILEKIVNESYRPLLRGFIKNDKSRVTLNINSVLTEILFNNGYRDVIDNIKMLVEMQRIELTSSSKFHAFLPLIPEAEIIRQIKLNDETNSRFFGSAYKPKGFFSPEMAYSPKVATIVARMGYEWMLADEVAYPDTVGNDLLPMNKIYDIKGSDPLKIYFREKNPTNVIMAALVRSADSFKTYMQDRLESDSYVVTAMDAETFGHHRPGLEDTLFAIMQTADYETVLISDLPKYFKETREVMPLDSTWASSRRDVAEGNPYNYWFDKRNAIHTMEWQLADIAIRAVNDSAFSDEKYPSMMEQFSDWSSLTKDQQQAEEKKRQWVFARDLLDKSLNSDSWWWACAIPWWSIEEIEKGMNNLLKVVASVPDVPKNEADAADDLYKKILIRAHEWQRTGKINEMQKKDKGERSIPLSKRFAAEHYYAALMEALKAEELKASSKREYEKAIKWRDSQYKLERDLDIYDAVHIIDVFRNEGDFKQFEEKLAKYKDEYRRISKGQPE